MVISEVIAKLEEILEQEGDLPVVVDCVEATLVQLDQDDVQNYFVEII
jgi:hypothetical protein